MTYNLLVSFELGDWLREGALAVAAIEEFGPATRIFGTSWFVCSEAPAEEVARAVQQVLSPSDALLVLDVDARVAAMSNVDDRSVQFMRRHWRSGSSQVASSLSASQGERFLESPDIREDFHLLAEADEAARELCGDLDISRAG
jgi:hypothetical protein